MMKVLIDYEHHSAIFDLPHSQLEVSDYLLSAGIQYPYADLMLNEDDSPDIAQVKLIAETSIDNWLQSLFSEDDQLSTVNTVCDLFYRLPIPQQIDLTHRMADGDINDDEDLLSAIKNIKTTQSHELSSILFSRVRLWTHEGEECEFYVGGVPNSLDDLEDSSDFEDFIEFLSCGSTKDMTAYVTTFSEGDGETQPASQADIDRIYTAIADVDIDTITGWTWLSESSFTFDYDIDELFNMKGME